MRCAKCNAKLDLTLDTCATCGVAVRGGGLPDEIATYIEGRVLDALANEKNRAAAELARAAVEEELVELKTKLEGTREALRRNEREPRSLRTSPPTVLLQRASIVLVVAILIGGVLSVLVATWSPAIIVATCVILSLSASFVLQTMRRGALHTEREALREAEADLVRRIVAVEPPAAQIAPYR